MSKILNTSSITSKYKLPDETVVDYSVDSNESSTEYMTDSFSKVRTSAKTYGQAKDEITQTLTLTNNSEYQIFDITVVDTISQGGSFKAGSLMINNESKPDDDITVGVTIDPIEASNTTTISYTVIIDDDVSVASVDTISNITYSVNEVTALKENSNEVSIDIVNQSITIVKTANVKAVIKGGTIEYTNVITNEGTANNTQITFQDNLPQGVTFDAGSVTIDDVPQEDYDVQTGFSIKDLAPNDSVTIKFSVTVN